jgi:precorrin-2/cobalt-factor-2 C20-methyltransferase
VQAVIRGRLLGVGVGPGDPELLTLKAVRVLQESPVIAYVSAEGRPSRARRIAAPHLRAGQQEINTALPMQPARELAQAAYDEAASRIGTELERGQDVAVLCEGDPLLYGSFTQLFDRLGERYPTEVVPGVMSLTAAAATARAPLVRRTQSLAVLPATLPIDALATHLAQVDAAVILKLGRRLRQVRALLQSLGMLDRAIYVEHASEARERVVRLADLDLDEAPYFSLILLPAGPSS